MDLGLVKYFSHSLQDKIVVEILTQSAKELLSTGPSTSFDIEVYNCHVRIIRYYTTKEEFAAIGLKEV